MTKGFWFNFLKNLTLGTTALVVLIIVLNNFFHVPVFQSLKPQVAKAAEVSPGAACCRAGIENNLCSPGTGNEWKYFSTQSECDTWAQTLNTYGYTCNPGEGTVGGSCTQDGDGSIRCRGGISQSVVNPSFCGTPPPPAPTVKYRCDTNSYACTRDDTNGTYTDINACLSACQRPAPTVKYRCDTNNYACVRDDTNGAYTSISACDTACTRPVTQKFRCDTNTYACIRDDINGNYTDAASCIAGCVRPAVPKYRCDTNTYACVRDDVNGAYTDNYACSTACQRSNVPTCQLSASVNGMNATLTTTPSISAYSISRYLFYFGIGSEQSSMTNTMSYYHYTQGTYQAYSAFVYMDSYGQTQTSQRCYTTYTAYSAPSWPPPGGYIPPTCNYSIQAAFKTPYSGQWAQNLTVAAGTQVQVGAFRNSDYNSFPGDMTIHLTGPGVDMYPANNSSFTPTQPGSYVLQVSYSNCTAVQAFLTVGGGGNSCNYSIQAAFKNTSFGGQWLQNLTTTVNTPIQIGAFRNSDYNNFYNDMTIYLTGPGVTNTNPANGSTFTPTQAGTYTLQVSYAGCAAVQAYLTVSGGGGYFPVLNVNKKVIYNGVEYDNLDATVHKFAVGEMINYKIYYQNVGATAAYNVVLVDRPAVYLSPTNYGSASWDGALLTFNLGSLGISGSGSVQYTAQVRSNLPAGDTTQTNVAQIRADNMTTMVSDTASVVVGAGVVQGTPALQITKTPSNQTVSFGGTANFSIQVVNISSVNVNNISIIDSLPSGFYFTGGSTSGATTNNPSISGNQLTWSNFTLTPGSSLIINFRATAPNYPGSFTNSARALFDGGSAGPVIVGVSVQQEVIINTYVPATTVQTPVINPIVLTTFVPVSSGQVLGVTTLPKTGSEALFLGGLPFLGGLGYKLREYRSRKKGENFIDIFSQRQRDRQGPSILG